MRELDFILNSILSLVVGAFLVRLLLQFVRTDYRNPLAQAVLRLTSPVVVPLRRFLPPIGRLDTASAVATLLAQSIKIALLGLLWGVIEPPARLTVHVLVDLLDTTLMLYWGMILVYAMLGWVDPAAYNPAARLLGDITAPILRPLRRALPPLGGLDLSPLAAMLLLYAAHMAVGDRIGPALLRLVG
jgi:YggT family protein